MNHEQILNLIKENKIDTGEAMVACSCDEAWENNKENILKKHKDYTYDKFCALVGSMWYDCEDNTGVTVIADWVAQYLSNNKDEPDDYYELYEECGD